MDLQDDVEQMMIELGLDGLDMYRRFKIYHNLRRKADLSLDCFPSNWVAPKTWVITLCKEFDEHKYDEVMSAIDFAIQQINAKIGKTYKFVDVIKVGRAPNFMTLLSFTARDDDGFVKSFQAAVYFPFPFPEDPELRDWRFQPDPSTTSPDPSTT